MPDTRVSRNVEKAGATKHSADVARMPAAPPPSPSAACAGGAASAPAEKVARPVQRVISPK